MLGAIFLKNKITLIACGLLLAMLVIMILSVVNDSVTTDEQVYPAAGYSYLTEGHYRLNFEHPPLGKMLIASPLLFLDLKPISEYSIGNLSNFLTGGQWNLGLQFLFEQTESVDKILLLSRLMIILASLALGFLIFLQTKKVFGNIAGLTALTFFVFSPTILAHGRLATLDMMTALAAFAATYCFVCFLEKPNSKNLILAGVILGLSQLIKFTLLLLFPFFIFLVLLWLLIKLGKENNFWRNARLYSLRFLAITAIAIAIIFVVYSLVMINYPPETQARDIEEALISNYPNLYHDKLSWFPRLAFWQPIRPLVQYAFGILAQFSREIIISYFLGHGWTTGSYSFYPIVFLIKEALPFSIATLLAFVLLCASFKPKKNFFITASLIWVAIYWLALVFLVDANGGIRYLLPIFPFMFFLVGGILGNWIQNKKPGSGFIKIVVAVLIVWLAVSTIRIFPHFLSNFNELVGGPDNGYKYVVDSDLDWGQNAKRLALYAEKAGITSIAVPDHINSYKEKQAAADRYFLYHYSYQHYLGEKYLYLPADTPTKGWIAVPATLLQWGRTRPFAKDSWWSDSYRWLDAYQPVTKIGYSVFVYYIHDEAPGWEARSRAKLESAQYSLAAAKKQQDPDLFIKAGLFAIEGGDFEKSVAANLKALELNPENTLAYNNLGWSYQQLNRLNRAIEMYQKALEINPDFELARNNLNSLINNIK